MVRLIGADWCSCFQSVCPQAIPSPCSIQHTYVVILHTKFLARQIMSTCRRATFVVLGWIATNFSADSERAIHSPRYHFLQHKLIHSIPHPLTPKGRSVQERNPVFTPKPQGKQLARCLNHQQISHTAFHRQHTSHACDQKQEIFQTAPSQ